MHPISSSPAQQFFSPGPYVIRLTEGYYCRMLADGTLEASPRLDDAMTFPSKLLAFSEVTRTHRFNMARILRKADCEAQESQAQKPAPA